MRKSRLPVRLMALLLGFSLLFAASVGVISLYASEIEVFCNADGPPFDPAPPGWQWQRDGGNNCNWTLFNDQGDRASDAIYEDMRLFPPPPPPSRLLLLFALVGVAVSMSGTATVMLRRDRRGPSVTSIGRHPAGQG